MGDHRHAQRKPVARMQPKRAQAESEAIRPAAPATPAVPKDVGGPETLGEHRQAVRQPIHRRAVVERIDQRLGQRCLMS